MPIVLPQDTRYGSPTSLNHSALCKFVSYDYKGIPSYNVFNYLNPPPFEHTDFTKIGSIVDEHITEGIDFETNYTLDKGRTVDQYKEILMPYVDERGLKVGKWKKEDWQSFFVEIFGKEEVDTRQLISASMYATVEKVIRTFDKFQFDADRTVKQFLSECETQVVVEGKGRKGKIDLLHRKDNYLVDMKIVGSMDRFISELTYNGAYNVHHQYCRQLAYYNDLLDHHDYNGLLLVVDHSGNKNIFFIPNSILRRAQELNERDIAMLERQLQSPTFFTTFKDPDVLVVRKEPFIPDHYFDNIV